MVTTSLRLRLLSATDIKRNWLSGDQAYVVAWVDPEGKKRTTATTAANNTTVRWNEELDLPFSSSTETRESLKQKKLTMEIRSKGVFMDSVLATVYVPLMDVPFDGDKDGNLILSYQAFQPSERKQYGCLNFNARIMQSVKSSDFSLNLISNTFMGYVDPSEEVLSEGNRPIAYPSLCSPETVDISSCNSYHSPYRHTYSQPYLSTNHQGHWQPPSLQTSYYFSSVIYPPLSGETPPYGVSSIAISHPRLQPYHHFSIPHHPPPPVHISNPHLYCTSVYSHSCS